MARRIDWQADRFRKRDRPLHTEGELRDYRRQAKQLAERVAKGRKSTTAWKHGEVRILSDAEKAEWAAQNGFTVKR